MHRLLYRAIGVADPAHYTRHRNLRKALDSLSSFSPATILDAGSGAGDHTLYLARRYPRARVTGIDVDDYLIERSNTSAERLGLTNARFEHGDLTKVSSVEEYDLIISLDVLEHIVNQSSALNRLSNALRPGGWCFYHIPTSRPKPVPFSARLQDFHDWAESEHLAEELTAHEFVRRVGDSGLEIAQSWRTFGYWTAELANSLFALGFRNTLGHRIYQAAVAPACRVLALADGWSQSSPRYAVAVLARRP